MIDVLEGRLDPRDTPCASQIEIVISAHLLRVAIVVIVHHTSDRRGQRSVENPDLFDIAGVVQDSRLETAPPSVASTRSFQSVSGARSCMENLIGISITTRRSVGVPA